MVDRTVDKTVACWWTGRRHDGGRVVGRRCQVVNGTVDGVTGGGRDCGQDCGMSVDRAET